MRSTHVAVWMTVILVYVSPTLWGQQTYNDSSNLNTWNTTDSNWSPNGTWLNQATSQAIFGGTGEAVAVGSPGVNANGVTFNSSGYTLSGGTINLTGTSPSISVTTSGHTATISSLLAGNAGLTKSGAGTLTLSGNNSYAGGTIVNEGVLVANLGVAFNGSQGGSLSTGNITINAGARLNTGGVFVLGGNANTRTLTINGGTVDITAAGGGGEYIRTLNLTGGTVTRTGTAAFFRSTTGGFNINSLAAAGSSTISTGIDLTNTSLNVDVAEGLAANDLVISGNISQNTGAGSGNKSITKTGSGTLLLSGSNSFTGGVVVNAGTIKIGHQNALGAYLSGRPVNQVTVSSGAAVDFSGINDATYGYTISGTGLGGTGSLTNTGTAIGNGIAQTSNITLAANAAIGGSGNWAVLTNAYAATNVNLQGFTLQKVGNNTIGFASTTVTSGTIQVDAGTLGLGLAEGGTGVNASAAALSLANTAGATVSIGRASSVGSLAGGGATGGNLNLNGNVLTIGARNTNTSYAGVISGVNGRIIKTGTGSQTFSGTNSYTGGTVISQGTVIGTTSNSAFGTGDVTLGDTNTGAANTALLLGDARSIGNNITVAAVGSGTVTIGTSDFNIASNTNFGGTLSLNRDVMLQAGATDRTTFSNVISGTGNITVTSPFGANRRIVFERASGTANSFTGSVTIDNNARLQIGVANSIGNRTITDTSAIRFGNASSQLHIAPTGGSSNDSETIGSLVSINSGAGAISLITGNAFTLNFGADNTNAAYSGTIANNLALTKIGSGTQTFSGTNTYTGATTISGGKLSVANIGNGGVAGNLGQATSASGNLVLNGGVLEYTGTTASTNRGMTFNDVVGSGIEITQATNTLTVSGVLTGAGGFTKLGAGTLTLSGANTYAGATNVSAGTLAVNGSTSAASTVNIGTAGTLAGSGTIGGNATLTGNGIINKTAGSIAGTLAVTGGNWNGVGSVGGVVTSSSGTFTIGSSGHLTASSGLNVTGGTLAAAGPNSTITGNVTYTSSQSSTFAGVIAGAGSTLTLNNVNSTLTLSGTNTYTGATNVQAGTLVVNGSIGTGDVTVFSGATLAGEGTLGGDTYVLAGGTLNPGNSPGTMNFLGDLNNLGTINMELGGLTLNSYDVLNGNGTGIFTFGGTLALNNTFANYAFGDSLAIFTNWHSFSGSFDLITGTDLGNGLFWDTSQLGVNGTITVIAVPEPSSIVVLALLGGLGAYRLRCRSQLQTARNERSA
jgi:fibronectin-binding autotransporter adhesin